MPTTVYIATSLDGFIARKNGDLDWLPGFENAAGEDYGYSEFMARIDAIVIGRGTYEKVLTFGSWPYERKVFLLSSTLREAPKELEGKLVPVAMQPRQLLDHLAAQGFARLYIDGGKVIQSFLREDLIDEMIITRIPVLIGDGIPLFGLLDRDLQFRLVKSDTYPNGLVKSWYERSRGG